MSMSTLRSLRLPHRHRAVSTHVVVQRAGIPYELERTVCSDCAITGQATRRVSRRSLGLVRGNK